MTRHQEIQRNRLVDSFLEQLEDADQRRICHMYMRGRSDNDVCREMRLKPYQLRTVKLAIAAAMRQYGIVPAREAG